MEFSQREKVIAAVLGLVVGGLGVNHFVVGPYLVAREKVQRDLSEVTVKLNDAQRLLNKSKQADAELKVMFTQGLQKNAPDAQGQTLHALHDWAQAARVEIQSLKPDRITQVGDFQEIRFAALGTGSMSSLTRLLWSIETSPLPLRVVDMRVSSRKEGSDDLLMQLDVSTIAYVPPEKSGTGGAR